MAEPRPLKKSETLEIRIPYPTKQAFMARCRAEGRSASEELRTFIEGQLDASDRPRGERRSRPWIVGALIAAAMGAMAAPALARASITTGFDHLDADHDGRIAQGELLRLDRDHDGAVSRDEFQR